MSTKIVLQVPSDPNMSRVARLAAGGLCSLLGFDVDQIEDVKIAVSEIILALIENGDGGEITLRFETDPESPSQTLSPTGSDEEGRTLSVSGSTVCVAFDASAVELELCRAVLSGVSKSCSIMSTPTGAEIRVVLPGERE